MKNTPDPYHAGARAERVAFLRHLRRELPILERSRVIAWVKDRAKRYRARAGGL